jgi:hypothetical protein
VEAVTDANGTLVETRGYDAFGAPRTGTWGDLNQLGSTAITPRGFTAHEHLNTLRLIHMNGRIYDYCGFRPMPVQHSGACRPPIPAHAGPRFRPCRSSEAG